MSELLSALPGPLQTLVYFFLALFPLVLIHEFGHFIVAKLNRVRVDEFGIGFPPRLARLFSAGGTDYTINVLPLGGFVRLAGEDDPDVPGAFAAKPKRVRAAVLFAGPLANFVLAAVILAGVAMTFGIPTLLPEGGGMVRVSQVLDGRPAAAAGILPGDLIYAVNGHTLVELAKAIAKPDPDGPPAIQALKAQAEASADKPLNLALLRGVEPVAAGVPPGISTEPLGIPDLDARRVVAAAAGSGLAAGDIIVAPLTTAIASALVLRPRPGSLEGGAVSTGASWSRTLTVTPRRTAPDQPAQMGIGIEGLATVEHLGIAAALVYGPRQTVMISTAMIEGLVQMITGAIAPALAGPVGIAKMGQQAGQQGPEIFLFFMAILSLNLGIINLLPIPALDGGRLLFIAVEALRGRRVEPNREAVVHLIGFAFVIGLMAVITVWEIARMSGFTTQ